MAEKIGPRKITDIISMPDYRQVREAVRKGLNYYYSPFTGIVEVSEAGVEVLPMDVRPGDLFIVFEPPVAGDGYFVALYGEKDRPRLVHAGTIFSGLNWLKEIYLREYPEDKAAENAAAALAAIVKFYNRSDVGGAPSGKNTRVFMHKVIDALTAYRHKYGDPGPVGYIHISGPDHVVKVGKISVPYKGVSVFYSTTKNTSSPFVFVMHTTAQGTVIPENLGDLNTVKDEELRKLIKYGRDSAVEKTIAVLDELKMHFKNMY